MILRQLISLDRNIMLSICYLVLYLSFNEHGATNIGYIPVISVQQIGITYSLFSTIATSLARFANEFNTHGGSMLELKQSRHEHYDFSSSQLPEAPSMRLDSRRSTMATPSKRLVDDESKALDDILAIQCRSNYDDQSFDARRSHRQKSRNRPSDADSDDSTQGIVKKQDFGI